MATRRLPATPILVFQITVNHQTYIVYIHKMSDHTIYHAFKRALLKKINVVDDVRI